MSKITVQQQEELYRMIFGEETFCANEADFSSMSDEMLAECLSGCEDTIYFYGLDVERYRNEQSRRCDKSRELDIAHLNRYIQKAKEEKKIILNLLKARAEERKVAAA